tara:strand:+ start:87 stop:317 length:231 start_codon:yes stop_codon:yes gene_type:complete
MSKSKTETLGNYICKIGKYDVRQTLTLPKTQKNFSGTVTRSGGSTEGRVYKGKKLILGKLSGASDAINAAFKMTCE